MSDAIVVFMTSANADEARRIANELVERQLAACVQILPEIESVYRWNGEVQRETELLLLAKTTAAQFDDLERAVREIHSYDTPEIVAVSMTQVSEPYLAWLSDNVRSTNSTS
ncbi:MAG: divalent-cation tolerance protein CutA [Pyrinomonadaceae bacterium]